MHSVLNAKAIYFNVAAAVAVSVEHLGRQPIRKILRLFEVRNTLQMSHSQVVRKTSALTKLSFVCLPRYAKTFQSVSRCLARKAKTSLHITIA